MIRQAHSHELNDILAIYAHARALMAQRGNPDQWGEDYPPRAIVEEDLRLGRLYAEEQDGRVCGVFMFAIGDDPSYRVIHQGSWLRDAPYAVIHRVASDGTAPGFFGRCLDFCRSQHPHLRMDTYKDNFAMQGLLTRHGFSYCGIIYGHNSTPLMAYELLP